MFSARTIWSLALVIGLAAAGSRLAAQTHVPTLESPVTDFTNSLSFVEWNELQKMLSRFEDTSAVAGRVVVTAGTEQLSADRYAERLFDANRLDTLAHGRSFLLLIVAGENHAAIQVGSGITGVLTGPVCARIVTEEIVPRLRTETVFSGIVAGLDAAMSTFSGRQPRVEPVSIAPAIALLLVLVIVGGYLLIVRPALRKRRRQAVGPDGAHDDRGWGYRPPSERPKDPTDGTSGPISGSW